jgi:hypothetical protein
VSLQQRIEDALRLWADRGVAPDPGIVGSSDPLDPLSWEWADGGAGAVRGWRVWWAWAYGSDNWAAVDSLVVPHRWRPSPAYSTAKCDPSWATGTRPRCTTPPPNVGCGCGFWATRDPWVAMHYAATRTSYPTNRQVLGVVSLWGRLVEAELGWRGLHARAEALVAETVPEDLRAPLASQGWPIVPFAELTAVVEVTA